MTNKHLTFNCRLCGTLLRAATDREMDLKVDMHLRINHMPTLGGPASRPLAGKSTADLAKMLPR